MPQIPLTDAILDPAGSPQVQRPKTRSSQFGDVTAVDIDSPIPDSMQDRITRRNIEMQVLEASDLGSFALRAHGYERITSCDRRGSAGRGSTR